MNYNIGYSIVQHLNGVFIVVFPNEDRHRKTNHCSVCGSIYEEFVSTIIDHAALCNYGMQSAQNEKVLSGLSGCRKARRELPAGARLEA